MNLKKIKTTWYKLDPESIPEGIEKGISLIILIIFLIIIYLFSNNDKGTSPAGRAFVRGKVAVEHVTDPYKSYADSIRRSK
jgi:hypothetical protein